MATHSNILAWEIPWTEEPGRIQSIESQSWTQLSDLAQHNTYNLQHDKYNLHCCMLYITAVKSES